MRKTVSSYKNFITGEEVVKEKIKDGNLRGKFTVQVFDKNGDLTQEAETENVVSSTYEHRVLQDIFKCIGTSHSDLNNGANSYNNYRGNISGILLTTSREPENSENIFIEGDEISYKHITQVNALECSSKFLDNGDLKITYIMDYLTTESNGVFQSIYLTQGFTHSNPNGTTVKRCNDIYPYFANFCFTVPFRSSMHDTTSSYEDNNWFRFYVQNKRFSDDGLDLRNISFTRGGCPLVCRWDIDAKVWRYYEFDGGENHFWLTGMFNTVLSDFSYKTPFEDADGNFYHFHWTYPYTLGWNLVITEADKKLSCRIEKIDKNGIKVKDIVLDFASLIPNVPLSAICGIAPFMTHDGKVLFQLSFRGDRTADTSYADRYWLYKQRMFNLITESFEESWTTNGNTEDVNVSDRGMMDCETNNYPCTRDQKLRRYFRQLVDKRLPYKVLDSELPHIIWGTSFYVYDTNVGDARPSTRFVAKDNKSIHYHTYMTMYSSYSYDKKIMGYSKKFDGWFAHANTETSSRLYYTRGIVFPISQWFAHTCLPNPVTKTDVETMKIKYEIIVPFNNFPKFTGNGGLNAWTPNMGKISGGI